MKIESIAENSLLYDFYGQLLSKRQQEVMALYHEEEIFHFRKSPRSLEFQGRQCMTR